MKLVIEASIIHLQLQVPKSHLAHMQALERWKQEQSVSTVLMQRRAWIWHHFPKFNSYNMTTWGGGVEFLPFSLQTSSGVNEVMFFPMRVHISVLWAILLTLGVYVICIAKCQYMYGFKWFFTHSVTWLSVWILLWRCYIPWKKDSGLWIYTNCTCSYQITQNSAPITDKFLSLRAKATNGTWWSMGLFHQIPKNTVA